MDLTIDQPSLARALRQAARVAPTKTTLPILQHALLIAEPGRLTVTACDHDLAALTTIAADVAVPGRVAIGARLLADYVAGLPPRAVRLTLDGAKRRARATCERSSAQFATGAADGVLDRDAAALAQALDRVLPAVAREHAANPALTAVRFALDGDGLTLAACDGSRLAQARVPDSPGVDVPAELLVPGHGAVEFGRLLDGAKAGGSLARLVRTADDRGLWLAHGDTALHARLTEGAYPVVAALVPPGWDTRAVVVADALRGALRLGALFGDRDQRPVLLDAAGGRLRLLTAEGEGGTAETILPDVALEGTDAAIMLDAPLVAALLDAVPKAARLILSWDGPGAALTIREQGRDEADLWLAMPLLLDAALHQRAVATRVEATGSSAERVAA